MGVISKKYKKINYVTQEDQKKVNTLILVYYENINYKRSTTKILTDQNCKFITVSNPKSFLLVLCYFVEH